MLWIAGLDELAALLPTAQGAARPARLLIHDALTVLELSRALPILKGSLLSAALLSTGLLERGGAVLRVRPRPA